MQQLDIFLDCYPYRPGYRDHFTSKAAAKAVEESAEYVQERILIRLRTVGPIGATSYELAHALDLPYGTVQPRTSELRDQGLIRKSGMTRPSAVTGKQGAVWVLS